MSRVPKVPVIDGKDVYPKLEMDEQRETGSLRIESDDLGGFYDYIPDVNSLSIGAEKERQNGRTKALEIILNDKLEAKLNQEGYSLQTKELVVQVLEDSGNRDGEKFIKKLDENNQLNQAGAGNLGAGISPQGIAGQQGMDPSGQPIVADSQQQIPQPTGQTL